MAELAKDTTVLILAGGRGTRIADLTPNTPKPMVMVAGSPFLEWIIRRLVRENFTNILLSIGHMADVVTQWLTTRKLTSAGEKVAAHTEHTPLGTGGAVADALTKIHTPYILVLNGDTLLLSDFAPALKRMVDEKLDGMIVARHLDDTGRYGRLAALGGILTAFEEKKPGAGLINGGVYVFPTTWLKRHISKGASSIETDVFPRLLREGARIGIEVTHAPFIDIGTPETLAEASTFVKAHKASF